MGEDGIVEKETDICRDPGRKEEGIGKTAKHKIGVYFKG